MIFLPFALNIAPMSRSEPASWRPEVLAPAGNRAAMEAAMRAGADAVYFGLHGFNARARATNFDADDLRAADRRRRDGASNKVFLCTKR